MCKILVADDDRVMLRLLELNLNRAGFSVRLCRNGEHVLPEVAYEKPDLAIFDLLLPGKDGWELVKLFQSRRDLRDVPLIIVTELGKASTRDELLAAGASCVFTKPFSPTALINMVRQLLEEKKTYESN